MHLAAGVAVEQPGPQFQFRQPPRPGPGPQAVKGSPMPRDLGFQVREGRQVKGNAESGGRPVEPDRPSAALLLGVLDQADGGGAGRLGGVGGAAVPGFECCGGSRGRRAGRAVRQPAALPGAAAGRAGRPPHGLLALSAGLRALAGALPRAGLAALAFLNGLLSTLAYTAGAALLPRLVPAGLLARANSLNGGALMGAPLAGYGVGGVLVHLVGAGGTLLVGALPILSLAAAALALPRLPGAAPPTTPSSRP